MISHDQALAIVLSHVRVMPETRVKVSGAAGRALARPLRATLRWPRCDQSAMDGIAVRSVDVSTATPGRPVTLRLGGELPAGTSRRLRLRPGSAIKVFTGSPLPAGADAVVMREDCAFTAEDVAVRVAATVGQHVRRAGEEFQRGDVLLPAGTPITPPVIGLLALLGLGEIAVHAAPRVGIIATGDELVAAGEPLASGKIRDAVGPALAAALASAGIDRVRTWRAADDPGRIARTLRRALRVSDVVITVGGASVGDHDHLRDVRQQLGISTLFDRVAVKPGKPNLFGLAPGSQPVFSLPGNPVSALVSYRQLVLPALRVMMGRTALGGVPVSAQLTAPVRRESRRQWLRATLQQMTAQPPTWQVTPLVAQGSHLLAGLARANALVDIPEGTGDVPAGAVVTVHSLDW